MLFWNSNFYVTIIIYTTGKTFDNHNNPFNWIYYFFCKKVTLKVNIGSKVAIKKEQKSKDLDINSGKILAGIRIPTNNDLEKSGVGKNISPPINPKIIEK